jgi:fused signal recognition particle receptor
VDHSIDKDELERSTHRTFGAQEGRQFMRRDTPITSVTEGQEIARRSRDRGPNGFGPPGLAGRLSPPTAGVGAQTGVMQPETTASGPRRVGRGLFAVPPDSPAGSEAGTQNAPAVQGIMTAPTGGAQTPPSSRGRGRTFLGRNLPPAGGQVAPNGAGILPSTDGFAGAQSPPQPGTPLPVPQSPTVDGVQTTPSGVRVRRFGPAAAMPRTIVPPSVATVAPPPAMVPPVVGLQRGPAIPIPPPVPIAPPPATVVPPMMQSHPAPIAQIPVIVPQAPAPAPQAARPLGRGLIGGFQVP